MRALLLGLHKGALALSLLCGCGPRPEELLACKRICEPMAWEVPRAGVCHCMPRQHSRDEGDAGHAP